MSSLSGRESRRSAFGGNLPFPAVTDARIQGNFYFGLVSLPCGSSIQRRAMESQRLDPACRIYFLRVTGRSSISFQFLQPDRFIVCHREPRVHPVGFFYGLAARDSWCFMSEVSFLGALAQALGES